MNNNRYILGSNNNLICGVILSNYKFMEYMVVPFDRDYKSTILQESNCGLWMVTVKSLKIAIIVFLLLCIIIIAHLLSNFIVSSFDSKFTDAYIYFMFKPNQKGGQRLMMSAYHTDSLP